MHVTYRTNGPDGTGNLISLLVVESDERIDRQHIAQRFTYRQFYPALLKRCDHALRRNVSNQRVLREGTATKTTKSGIKAPTARIVCSEHFSFRVARCAVQMHANVVSSGFFRDRLHHAANQISVGNSDGVSQRD